MKKINFSKPSDELWQKMFHNGLSLPVSLTLNSDIPESFIYDRRYGVFPVEFAHHDFAMALFWALDNGFDDHWDVDPSAVPEGYSTEPMDLAELWLINTKGTCYRSTLTPKVFAGKKGNLNEKELDYFDQVYYIGR